MPGLRIFAFDRLDRYALRQLAPPMILAVAALLTATLLGRLLRLIDLAASAGVGAFGVVYAASALVPHYLGLVLPLAFTAGIFAAVARMSDDNELDIILSSGRSIARMAAPFFVLGAVLCAFNFYLFGSLQPLSRYAYHMAVDQILRTSWESKIEENRFVDAGKGLVFSADAIEGADRHVRGVFIARKRADAQETTTSATGQLESSPNGNGPKLLLDKGVIVSERRDGEITVTRFEKGQWFDIVPTLATLRQRGDALSERTLRELWADMQMPDSAGAAAEFHGRLARSLLPPLLPLMALPLGMASKRGRRTPGVVFAGLALLLLHHALQFGESMAANGRIAAAPALWTPFAVFCLLSLWIFVSGVAWPGDNSVSRTVRGLAAVLHRLRPRWSVRAARPT